MFAPTQFWQVWQGDPLTEKLNWDQIETFAHNKC